MHRVGIIPFDIRDKLTALLFVTSMTRGRWILPKGSMEPGETHVDACHREGFEEAGVRGVVFDNFPMTVPIGKTTSKGIKKIPVTYYPFLVQQQEEQWPERERRQRHWALIEEAPKVAYRDDFLHLINQFTSLQTWIRDIARSHKS